MREIPRREPELSPRMKGFGQRSDLKNMPQLLDQASDAPEHEASRPFAISLYADVAQAHKQAIIPYIPRMMASIVRSLPFISDTQQLHQACANAVASIARYTVDPSRRYESNQEILSNLCSPLIPVLASKLELSATGAAVCLQALVESEKWKFAHPDLQGRICSKATAALEEQGVHSVALLRLVKSLARLSRDASQCHIAEWMRVGLQVLQEDLGMSGSWQQRLAAAQLIGVILKMAEPDELGLDLHVIAKVLEAFLTDKVNVVQIAIAEALETLKAMTVEKSVDYQLPDSNCEGKRRNLDTEESGFSDSLSSKSATSSHEALPRMASSTVKFGMDLKTSQKQPRDSLCLTPPASLDRLVPSKLKGNTTATMPRRVLSEIPASGKLLYNSEASSCPSRPVRRSSVDTHSKISNYLMQEKILIGSEKSIEGKHNQIYDGSGKASLHTREHVEGCQNPSKMNCTSVFRTEEDESDNQLACTDHLNGKVDFEVLGEHEGGVEEVINRMPTNCRRVCINDDCAHTVPNSSCMGNVETREDASNGRIAAQDIEGHPKMQQARSLTEEFPFRPPSNLLQSLQSSRPPKKSGERGEKFTDDSDVHLSTEEAGWNESGILASCESEESGAAASGSEKTNETSGASCCSASKDLNSSRSRMFRSDSCMDGQSLLKSHGNSKCPSSVQQSDCQTHFSREEGLTLSDCSDSEVEKFRRKRSRKLHRSSKKGHNITSATSRPGSKPRGAVDQRSKESAHSEGFKKQMICAGTLLGFAGAVLLLVVAGLVIHHLNQAYDSHNLVPT